MRIHLNKNYSTFSLSVPVEIYTQTCTHTHTHHITPASFISQTESHCWDLQGSSWITLVQGQIFYSSKCPDSSVTGEWTRPSTDTTPAGTTQLGDSPVMSLLDSISDLLLTSFFLFNQV